MVQFLDMTLQNHIFFKAKLLFQVGVEQVLRPTGISGPQLPVVSVGQVIGWEAWITQTPKNNANHMHIHSRYFQFARDVIPMHHLVGPK